MPAEETSADANSAAPAAKRQRAESAEVAPQAYRAPAPAERGGQAADDAPFVPEGTSGCELCDLKNFIDWRDVLVRHVDYGASHDALEDAIEQLEECDHREDLGFCGKVQNGGIHEVDTVCAPPPLEPFRKAARAFATAAAEFAAAAEQPDFRSQSRRAKASAEEATRLVFERQYEEATGSDYKDDDS